MDKQTIVNRLRFGSNTHTHRYKLNNTIVFSNKDSLLKPIRIPKPNTTKRTIVILGTILLTIIYTSLIAYILLSPRFDEPIDTKYIELTNNITASKEV